MSEAVAPRALVDDAAATVRGIAIVLLVYLLMPASDTVTKWAIPSVGVAGAIIWRGTFGGLTIAALAAADAGFDFWRRLVPVRWGLVSLRAAMQAFVSMAWYVSWTRMSLVDSYAIGYVTPLLMTLLAVPLLGERLRAPRLAATLVGFAGVLILLRPGGDLISPVLPLLLLGIVVMALCRIMTRLLSTTETPECLTVSMLAAHIPAGLLLGGVFPIGPIGNARTFLALIVLGVGNGVANYLFARAYALAPVSALAPYEYTSLVWGGVLGFAVFGEVPSWTTAAGATVIVGAGLYNLQRERARRGVAEPRPWNS